MATNYGIVDQNGKIVSIVTDGSVERLAVDAKATVSVNVGQFRPKTIHSTTDVALSDTADTEIFSVNGVGQIGFIAMNFSSGSVIIELEVDGNQVYRLNLSDLGNDLSLNGNAPGDQEPLYVKVANKQFRDVYVTPADFTSNFKVKARKTVPQTTNMTSYFVKYRVQV